MNNELFFCMLPLTIESRGLLEFLFMYVKQEFALLDLISLVPFCCFPPSFAFFSLSPPAHQGKILARNENYSEIGLVMIRLNIVFFLIFFFFLVKGLKLAPSGLDLMSYFHHVLWFGDLNYRIDLTREETIEKIDQKEFEFLRQHDQVFCIEFFFFFFLVIDFLL